MATAEDSAVFLDTNVLVYASVVEAPLHGLARERIEGYEDEGRQLWISCQIVREFLATLTRAQSFARPVPTPLLLSQVEVFLRRLYLADDTAATTQCLVEILAGTAVGGRQVHDANIVATMNVLGVTHLLTHNTRDFGRSRDLITVLPLAG